MDDYNIGGILSNNPVKLVQANHTKRFLNFVIDNILYAVIIAIGWFIAEGIRPGSFRNHLKENGTFDLMFNLTNMFFMAVLVGLVEALFKGKSLGKLITNTRAVNNNGSRINFNTALTRSLIRAIPFEQFTALGIPCYPIHDKWSKSIVIDEVLSSK